MREIKFRGKRIDNGEWVYGFLNINKTRGIHYIIRGQLVRSDNEKPINSFDYYEVLKEAVGQFVGLLDKNGKEAYEGDIVDIVYSTPDGYSHTGTIKIDSILDYKLMYDLDNSNEIEVIGNIYENPELLGCE